MAAKTWYYHLDDKKNHSGETVKGLYSSLPDVLPWDYMIIASTNPKGKGCLFTSFQNVDEYLAFESQILVDHRTFFELILGNRRQKPHFDFDCEYDKHPNINARKLFSDFLEMLIYIFYENNHELDVTKCIQVFSSDSTTKFSRHVVIDGYHHNDHMEAKRFYLQVLKLVLDMYPEIYHSDIRCIIDPAVYGKTQQYRLEGSQKLGSGRPKRRILEVEGKSSVFSLNDHLFIDGLVGVVPESSVSMISIIPSVEPEPSKIITNCGTLNASLIIRCMNLCSKSALVGAFPFTYDKVVSGNMICLSRNKIPTYCPVCKVVHSGDNPFIVASPDAEQQPDKQSEYLFVRYSCRRMEAHTKDGKKSVWIGYIVIDGTGETDYVHLPHNGKPDLGPDDCVDFGPRSDYIIVDVQTSSTSDQVGAGDIRPCIDFSDTSKTIKSSNTEHYDVRRPLSPNYCEPQEYHDVRRPLSREYYDEGQPLSPQSREYYDSHDVRRPLSPQSRESNIRRPLSREYYDEGQPLSPHHRKSNIRRPLSPEPIRTPIIPTNVWESKERSYEEFMEKSNTFASKNVGVTSNRLGVIRGSSSSAYK
jgi:hypothetical protein